MQTIKEKIQQRRLQLLIHSCIYYELNESIVSDATWSRWAKELVDLQNKYPQEASEVVYAKEFKNFDGSTGMDLPTKDILVMSRARHLLNYKPEQKVVTKQSGFLF